MHNMNNKRTRKTHSPLDHVKIKQLTFDNVVGIIREFYSVEKKIGK